MSNIGLSNVSTQSDNGHVLSDIKNGDTFINCNVLLFDYLEFCNSVASSVSTL